MQAGLANSDFDATAIAQHYSAELDAETWLVDVTSSPWVALFFASDKGKTGDVGTVDLIKRPEWLRYSGNGTTALGGLRVAKLESIPRIKHQKGFFLQAPHPALFEELVNERRYFMQEEGVVFESPLLDPPINRAWIYPEKDEVLEAIRAAAPGEAVEPPVLDWEPNASTLMAPTWEVYLPIARALLERHRKEAPDKAERTSQLDWDSVLAELSRFHAVLRAHPAEVPRYVRTLLHLDRAVHSVMTYGKNGPASLLRDRYVPYFEDSQKLVKYLFMASPFWEKLVRDGLKSFWPMRA
jgi:hypothetical protein